MWDNLPTEVKINSIKTRHPLIESIASETTDLPAKRLNQRPDMISGYLFKGWRMGEKCCIVCNVCPPLSNRLNSRLDAAMSNFFRITKLHKHN